MISLMKKSATESLFYRSAVYYVYLIFFVKNKSLLLKASKAQKDLKSQKKEVSQLNSNKDISIEPFLLYSEKNYSIVIARYDENLTWLDTQAIKLSLDDVYIYNKNEKPYKPGIYKNNFVLPNVGREAHTYLTYIVENYDRLKEYTMFLIPDWKKSIYAIYSPDVLGLMQRCNRVEKFGK